jgi:hypothetical protein
MRKLSSRSRGAGGIRGEEVLDRRELPDTLGYPGRALIVELILVRLTILGVSFGRPKTYRTSETNEETPWRKPGCSVAALAKLISFSLTA